jgi:hypothetical protein
VILTKLKVLEAVMMVANYFLKHGVPFQYDPRTRMPKRVHFMELKCADQIFGLRFKPKRDDYKQVANCKKKARITNIER